MLSDREEVEQLIASAMTKKALDWKIQYQPGLFNTLLPHLSQQRDLAKQVYAAALVDYTEGRHDEAVQRVREILFIADAVERSPMLVGHLVATGLADYASRTAQELGPGLKVGTAIGEASPEQLRQLIGSLLETATTTDGLRFALQSEVVMQINSVEYALGNPEEFKRRGETLFEKGKYELFPEDHGAAGRFLLDQMKAVLPAVEQPNAIAATAKLPLRPPDDVLRERLLVSILLPTYNRFIRNHFEAIASRRVAATALAVRWYAVEHQNLPTRLEDLLPNYLPAVPQDPMTDGQWLKYIADGDRPRVYSVGRNGNDDGGVPKDPDLPTRVDSPDDIVADLNRQPRPEPKVEEEYGFDDAFDDEVPCTSHRGRQLGGEQLERRQGVPATAHSREAGD